MVYEVDGERRFYIQEASAPILGRLKASLAGLDGKFVEYHELDLKTAKKVPKDLVGRVLKRREALRLLKKLR